MSFTLKRSFLAKTIQYWSDNSEKVVCTNHVYFTFSLIFFSQFEECRLIIHHVLFVHSVGRLSYNLG